MTIIRNEFDERIINPSDIQSFTQYDDVYVGESGYFSDYLCRFQCLKSCHMGTLTSINNNDSAGDYIFVCDDKNNYRYFIPEYLVKQEKPKKYRPFSLKEFLNIFKIGDVVTYRMKCSNIDEHHMFTGYQAKTDKSQSNISGVGEIVLSGFYELGYLFDQYELFLNGKWQPFGIEKE